MAAKKKSSGNLQPLVLRGTVGLCGLLALADFIIHRHAYFDLEATPLFFALMGSVSMGLVAALSALLRRLLTRPEDYYERRHDAVTNGNKKRGKNA